MLSVLHSSNADTSSWAAGKRSRMEASAGWVLILEAAAARKGRVLEEGFGCGAESAWCSLCVRSCVFVELVAWGLALRQSKGQGK